MRRLLLIVCLAGIFAGSTHARARSYGYCMQGGTSFNVSGIQATPPGQGSYPGCTVEVFLTGTLIHPTNIYSDNAGTVKANPFTADTTTGLWFWYADNNRYDVKLSGGNPSPGLGAGFTLGDIVLVDTSTLGFSTYFSAPFSATPTFNLTNGTIQAMVLTGNITSSSTSNQIVGSRLTLVLCQDGVGGRTVVFPASFLDVFAVATGPNQCSEGEWYFNGVSWKLFGNPLVGSPLTTLTANTWVALQTFSVVPAFPSQLTNLIFASPCGSSGVPSFRAACAADFPLINITSGAAGGVFSAGTTAGHVAIFASNNGQLQDGGIASTITSFSYTQVGLNQLFLSSVTNPTTTPLLTQTAQSVPPGTILMGPVPNPSGVNPSFETTFINNISSSTTLSITGAPLVSASSALIYTINDTGAVSSVVPSGFSTIENGTVFQLYTETLASTASISPVVTTAAPTNQFGNLFFLGGNINATPVHTALSSTLSCSAGDNCAKIIPGSAVSASNILVIVASFIGNTAGTATISDSFGDTFLKVGAGTTGGGAESGEVWLVMTPTAGTPTITIDGHESGFIIGGCCKMYELSGATPYFAGPNGPYAFRNPTQSEIASLINPTNISFFNTTLTADLAVAATTITAICPSANCTDPALTMPGSGCPCRVFISYSMYVNTASSGVGYNIWLTDGTATWGQTSQGQSNGASGGLVTHSWNGLSTVSYNNSQTVTFTLNSFGDHTFTVKSQSPVSGTLGNGPVLSSMQISIQTSK